MTVTSPQEISAARPETFGLALSGGGSRAMAFHLGCLRALHQLQLLDRVKVMAAVSGGSVLAALYCSHEGDFEEFEGEVRRRLRQGFVAPALFHAVFGLEGMRALLNFGLLLADRMLALPTRWVLALFPRMVSRRAWPYRPIFRRAASRTTILRRVFDEVLRGRTLADLRADRPRLIVIACELRAKAAFYFTRSTLHCWRYGAASAAGVRLADAVVASAAYPLFLPAIDTTFDFTRDGVTRRERVTLTDGGVYDNLGLMPFWPDRDHSISIQVENVDRLIACRAGYSLDIGEPAATWIPRMRAAFESVFARAQNASTSRLFDLQSAGRIAKFIIPYLGQNDAALAHRPAKLVTAASVAGYGTNFSAMDDVWIDRLSLRGEQLVIALVKEHWPELSA